VGGAFSQFRVKPWYGFKQYRLGNCIKYRQLPARI